MSQQPNKAKLFGIFMTIAVVADPLKYNAKIAELEQHFSNYIEVIKPLIELTPDDVISTLRARFPEIDNELRSPLAPKVITRIQEYLKQKGNNQNAD